LGKVQGNLKAAEEEVCVGKHNIIALRIHKSGRAKIFTTIIHRERIEVLSWKITRTGRSTESSRVNVRVTRFTTKRHYIGLDKPGIETRKSAMLKRNRRQREIRSRLRASAM
jgi:hypothetical protein